MGNKIKVYAPKARVLQVLHQSPRALTTFEVAEKASVAWATADKYLKIWEKESIVIRGEMKYHSIKHSKKMSKEVWSINRKVFEKFLKKD